MSVSFWILTYARSGSNYLCDLLNTTGQIPYIAESLHPNLGITKSMFADEPVHIAKLLRSHFINIFADADKSFIQKKSQESSLFD